MLHAIVCCVLGSAGSTVETEEGIRVSQMMARYRWLFGRCDLLIWFAVPYGIAACVAARLLPLPAVLDIVPNARMFWVFLVATIFYAMASFAPGVTLNTDHTSRWSHRSQVLVFPKTFMRILCVVVIAIEASLWIAKCTSAN